MSQGNLRPLARLPLCTWGPNKVVFEVWLYWHAPLNLPFECLNYINIFSQFVFQLQQFISFIERPTAGILSPIQYFPHFPAGTQFPASYLKWMAAAANKFSRFPLNSRHLKIPPPTQNKKLPTWSFSTDPIWNILRQIIRSFHFLQWNANIEYQVPIFPFSVFVKQPLFSQWDIASNPIFNPSSHSDAGETLEGANTVGIYKKYNISILFKLFRAMFKYACCL